MRTGECAEKQRWSPGRMGEEREETGKGGELKQMALLACTSLLNLFLLFFSCAWGFNPVVTCVPAWPWTWLLYVTSLRCVFVCTRSSTSVSAHSCCRHPMEESASVVSLPLSLFLSLCLSRFLSKLPTAPLESWALPERRFLIFEVKVDSSLCSVVERFWIPQAPFMDLKITRILFNKTLFKFDFQFLHF